ncbi:MAG TPA: AAA family ATPase [Planctomycetota bacterium]|nr:AAA family ATPase [Planctomycetota bacterium]
MPQIDLRLFTVNASLDEGCHFARPLFIPNVSTLHTDERKAENGAIAILKRQISEAGANLLRRLNISDAPALKDVIIELPVPRGASPWKTPLNLRFATLRWRHGTEAQVAYVPALEIEVVARTVEEMQELLPKHIRFALMRINALESLRLLTGLQRFQAIRVGSHEISVNLPSPKQIAIKENEEEPEEPLLKTIATDLCAEALEPVYEMEAVVAQMAEVLGAHPPRSILLNGKPGVGKTAAVHELVRSRFDAKLGHTKFFSTNGSRIVAGMTGYGMWQERCRKLCREAATERAVLYLGNLLELLDVGKAEGISQGIGSFLRPYIARGELLAICECTPEQLAVIEREDPQLAAIFHVINVDEPDETRGLSILRQKAKALSEKYAAEFRPDAITTANRLFRRYATYSAYPGRPLRFIQHLLQDCEKGGAVDAKQVIAAFSRETGLPLFILDPDVALNLDETRAWFMQRVLGQPEAVDLILDVLASAKAGLSRPRRPLASLLFIGPTGVGKTEMAKALAEILFGDKHRLIRFDMSEFADPVAVQRLTGGLGRGREGLLTARVREQPFSVILLDEFEKAHPLLFDLFLQVLGDARLTDAAGRVADFSNAVVIMTSNLGAQSWQQGKAGFGGRGGRRELAHEHFLQEVKNFFRPEFFNRMDRVVPFSSLDQETILGVARRELSMLAQRDGARARALRLELPDAAVAYLAHAGMDARYGARPLKRTIERKLLVPLADAVNGYSSEWALTTRAEIKGERVVLNVAVATDAAGKPLALRDARDADANVVSRAMHLRRQVQALDSSAAISELRNEVYRLEKVLLPRVNLRGARNEEEQRWLARLPRCKAVLTSLEELLAEVLRCEESIMMASMGAGQMSADARAKVDKLFDSLHHVLMELRALAFNDPDAVTLAIYSQHRRHLLDLVRAYAAVAEQYDFAVEIHAVTRRKIKEKEEAVKQALKPAELPETLDNDAHAPFAFVLGIVGDKAMVRFASEGGLHTFIKQKERTRQKHEEVRDVCRVFVTEQAATSYKPELIPAARQNEPVWSEQPRRYFYLEDHFATDSLLDDDEADGNWSGRELWMAVKQMMEACLHETLCELSKP